MSETAGSVLIVGSGPVGAATALALSARGHAVTMVDRDAETPRSETDAWGRWPRRSVPQFRQVHSFSASATAFLRSELPEVWRDLLSQGARDQAVEPSPGDGSTVLRCRRVIVEMTLRRHLREAGVGVAAGVAVQAGATGEHGHVRVTLADGARMTAQVVLDCSGRRSRLHKRRLVHHVALDYVTGWFRARAGVVPISGIRSEHLGQRVVVTAADGPWFSATIIRPTSGAGAGLTRAAFDEALRRDAAVSEVLSHCRAEAVGVPLHAGRLLDSLSTRMLNKTPPRVLPLGDAALTTNPMYARGVGLGLAQGRMFLSELDSSSGVEEAIPRMWPRLRALTTGWFRESTAHDALLVARSRSQAKVTLPEADRELLQSTRRRMEDRAMAQVASHESARLAYLQYLNTTAGPDTLERIARGALPSEGRMQ